MSVQYEYEGFLLFFLSLRVYMRCPPFVSLSLDVVI